VDDIRRPRSEDRQDVILKKIGFASILSQESSVPEGQIKF